MNLDTTIDQEIDMCDIKNAADKVSKVLDGFPQGREIALARTKLDECVMWAVASIMQV